MILSLAATCPYCLKGASGIERLLARHGDYPLVVYNVWQPVLPTDWGKPGTGALARLSNPRVRQFWDGDRLLARSGLIACPSRSSSTALSRTRSRHSRHS